ncbi:MAG: signal peptide peptidase SppA [Planctomycetaceae bacterium]|nr:signal peptide peptidase SppA [Planctomycetaceae bacterium]
MSQVPPSGEPQAYVTPQVIEHRAPNAPPRPAKRGWGGVIIGLMLLVMAVGLGIVIGMVVGNIDMAATDSHVDERYHSLSRFASDKVAIIDLEGTILEGDGFVKKQIDRVKSDKSVKAVVLRVNSPGGTVTGSDFMYHHLVKLREERKIPIVVSMGSVAASGGYYVSMCVGDEPNSIYAEPTTWTGSIGVVIPHYDMSGLTEKLGVTEDSIKSHRLKQMGSPFKEMTEEERKIFQGLVDDSFGGFKAIIKSGRPAFREHPENLDKVATGQVFTTSQALAAGLVDKQGFIEDAIDRAIEIAKLDKDDVKVVRYRKPGGLFDVLLDAKVAQRSDLAALFDLTTPRAYYLFSWPTIAKFE